MNAQVSLRASRLIRKRLCPACLCERRPFHKTRQLHREFDSASKYYISRPGEQANPVGGYYEELLSRPLRATASATRTPAAPLPPDELPKTDKEERLAKARLVFGSRLAGPIERRKQIDEKSRIVAGVLVPPRPGEPENCCMSGCVNCVWDQYRDELEEWAAKSAQAREALVKQQSVTEGSASLKGGSSPAARYSEQARSTGSGTMLAPEGAPTHVATSMDDDGGGSDTNWDAGLPLPGPNQDLFGGIPVGIREFMRTEKMLKERHRLEERASP